MPNWNLSVELAARGDLSASLRTAAKDARALDTALKSSTRNVTSLATASRTAARDLDRLSTSARTAARNVDTLATAARAAQRQLALISGRSSASRSELTQLRSTATRTARDMQRMSAQMQATVRGLDRLAASARTAQARTANVGDDGARSMRRLETAIAGARSRAGGLITLLAGGALIAGSHELVANGNELNAALNTFGATSNATSMQMARAADMANKLGNDLALPKASAVEAADAMVELSKAGFRTDQAISATRASLVLSAAAQVDAADSAKYLGDIMDQFGLSADKAGKTADTLAAAANNASGGVKEIYTAMSYAGPVAHGMGIDMQDASAAVAMLAKSGILGSKAGTTLRGMLTNMAKPTHQMGEGLKTLGIQAFDAQGNFKGLRYVIDQLQKSQQRLSQKDFTAAAGKAFGKPAMAGAIAIAHQGTQSFDALSVAVRQQGAATQIAAAQGKGLVGAMTQLKTQSKQTGLAIYTGMSPGLEYITRGITSALSDATPKITAGFKHLNAAAYLFGPDIKRGVHDTFAGIAAEARDLGGSLKGMGTETAADALNVLLNVGKATIVVLKNLVAGVEPIVHSLADIGHGGDGVSSTLNTVVYALDETAKAVGAVSQVLVPLGHLVGSLVDDFSGLPGPVQTAILAMLLARRVTPIMGNLAGTVTGRVMPAFRGMRDEMAVQRSLAAASGQSLSRYGAAFATLETRVPVVGRMSTAFRTASSTGNAFTGTLRGVGAAAGSGLRAGMGGLVSFLGGPWGAAIAAGTVVLGLWASAQQQAAQAAAEHRADVANLTQAMRESNGVTNDAVREQAANLLENAKVKASNTDLIGVLNKAGYSLQDVTDAYLGQGTSLKDVASRLDDMAAAQAKAATAAREQGKDAGSAVKAWNTYSQAAKTVRGLTGEADKAQKKAADLNAAIKGASNGTSAYDKLKTAVAALSDDTADADSRTRALRQALDLLSGGTLDYQAAEAQMNQAISNANDQLADGIKRADGYGKALINANGSVNTVTKNGQQLYQSLGDITDSTTAAAQAAYALAQQQHKSVPESIAAARKEMDKGRTAAEKLAKQYGILPDDAKKVADSVGLIPGQVAILLETKGVDSVMGELLAVQAQIKATPKSKTITVDALSGEAQQALKDLGYKIHMIPGTRQFVLTVPTGGSKSAIAELQQAINGLQGKTVNISVQEKLTRTITQQIKSGTLSSQAGKNILQSRADGGLIHRASTGLYVPGYRPRVDTVPAVLSEGEGVLVPETVRRLGMLTGLGPAGVIKRLNAWGRYGAAMSTGMGGPVLGFSDGGMVGVQHYADGGFTYTPTGAVRTSSDVQSAYSDAHQPITRDDYLKAVRSEQNAVDSLRTAEARLQQVRSHRHTHAALVSAENSVARARRTVATATDAAKKAEARYHQTFSLSDWSRTLASTVSANQSYEASLSKIAARGGADVIGQLRDMGAEGAQMVAALAKATNAQFASIVGNLRKLGPLAKATLADYTAQINATNKVSATFQQNLAKLAAMGYGALAQQLAAQGDDAAQAIAAQAVKSPGAASKANSAAKSSAAALSSDQLAELVQIIGSISSSKVGIHQVAAATGLGEDEIVAVAGKAAAQIKSVLGSRSTKFLADLARAQKGLSYADGGIRAGMYATQGGIVRFAEPSTGGEGYVPLGAAKRPQATRVLRDIAHRFGLGLTAAGSAGGITVIRQEGDTHIQVSAVRTGASASDIGTQVARSYRRAKRGGVNARG